jgi:hypothetical protein
MNRHVARGLTAAGAALFFSATVAAASLEQMQGAWVMEGASCSEAFKKSGGKVEFVDRDSSIDTGLIVSGKTITTPEQSCTVEKIRQEKDHISVLLGCSDAVMFSSISASFRMTDADHFERFETLFPDASFTYERCKF